MYRIKRSVKILKKVKLLKKEQYVEKINQSSLSNQEEDLNWQPDSERDLKRYRRSDSNDERDYDDITSEVELNQELMSAIRSNDLELKKLEKIKNLIQRGAYVNFQDSNVRHNTPLHAAVRKQEVEVVKLLLAEGAIQIKNDNSKIPLDLARRLGKKDIVLQLEKKIVLKRGNTGENKPEVDLPKKPKISFMKESKEIKEENIESKYPASGLKHTLHGSIYQLKLLMLFLKRGLDQGYSFRLATEWDDAEKFDDLVFMYDDSKGKNYRFLQAKHKLDEKNNKITIGDLLTKSKDGEFNLEKYFVSYLRIKKKKEFKDCNLKDFIVCTNIGFDMDNSVQDQVKKLKEVSSGKNKGKKVLVEAIDDYDSFFNTDTGIRYKIKCNDDLVSYLKQGNEVQNEVRGQLVDIIDKEIKEFFKKLVFAVGQPNEVKLGKMLEDEISENFNTRLNYIGQLSKDAYNKFEKAILDWFKEKEGRFFDNEKVKDLFMKMEQEVNSLSILEKEVKNIGQKVSEVHSHIIAGQNNKQVEEHVWFNIKSPSKLFTGREEELNKVHLALQHTKERIGVVSQGSSISGLGGIGKTELAREYVHRYAEEYSNNIIWIDAESYQTLTESFCRLASDKLKINIKNADGIDKQIISIVEDVYKFFANRRSLFIFDNAEKFENLSKFLPLHSFTPEANKPYVLITSRNRNLRAGIEVIDLDKLKLNDSIEFVKKGLFINDELQDQEIKNLVEKLQHFPLAIRQAIAYINDRKVTEEFRVSDYLKEYEIKTKDLLNYKVLHGINDDYIKTTFTTWEVTINKIENYKEYGQLALNILNIMAYFASENISRAMFLSLAGGNEEQLKSAVHLLINYSMVNGEKEQSVLSIHRLVQEVTRLKLQEQQRKKF
ncbi:ankyrin repeat domain-containing protein [Wolbachia endosymbiont (group A) of Sphaerophoria taeniata]|uniref:ankyrin repeat domain-containing protein n=1 Tax=Wolbachia endosymbiont (group A) of Sphaerophoria taeniata TaxID=2954057 RepID=UPI002227EE1E|nr:ankyrin repeat domain-containing protein [Wolbachia endosymbiont (group A) of Sphaerophoria taeniata]